MKFTLRDSFWLIALLALACGWYVDHRAQTIAYEKGLVYWHKTTSYLLQDWEKKKAENEALKLATKQQP
jgi:hypothetical protein